MTLLAIDLYCGLGGWAEGFLAEGYEVIGFDVERWPYPGQLVLQDVLTLHGSQFKNATIIVASPPCQAYSYRAMPWKRAKALPPPSNELFDACFRIQREASEAAGHKIPMIVENVRGAQKWVGRAKWHYGSYYLWGDVPALMPITQRIKQPGRNFHFPEKYGIPSPSFHGHDCEPSVVTALAIKNNGGSWFAIANNTKSGHRRNPDGRKGPGGDWFANGRQGQDACLEGIKQGGEWWHDNNGLRRFAGHSSARKQASALIAKIPFPVAQHIARVNKPNDENALDYGWYKNPPNIGGHHG